MFNEKHTLNIKGTKSKQIIKLKLFKNAYSKEL